MRHLSIRQRPTGRDAAIPMPEHFGVDYAAALSRCGSGVRAWYAGLCGRCQMSQFLQWIILTSLTGSPLGSAVFLVVFWLLVDRFTLGLLPDPFRWVMRLRREGQLKRILFGNPHDGRSRLELGALLVERGAHRRAIEVLRPNLEQGHDDVQTLFTMGSACIGAGYAAQGEQLLAHAKELDADFRVGEIDLVLGKGRLARGDVPGARAALEAFVAHRRGTIQGRVLLAKAIALGGDDARAALMRDEAFAEYVGAPRFLRRKERLWAWRARPSRPATYLLLVALALAFLGAVAAPRISGWADQVRRASSDSSGSE